MFFRKEDLGRARKLVLDSKKKILVYHRDADGVCSAALLMKQHPHFETIPREGPMMGDDFYNKLLSEKPDLILFVDIPIDQEWKKLIKLKKELKKTKIMIVDHHIIEKDMNRYGILHYNTKMSERFRNKYIPASCAIYHTMLDMGFEIKDFIWIAVIGIIGDYGFRDCASTIRACERMHPDSVDPKNIFNSRLARITDMISALMTIKGLKGAQECLRILVNADHYEDVASNRKLQKAYRIVEDEKKRLWKDFRKNREEYPGLIFYQIKSKLNITSLMSTMISERYPKDVIIIRKASRIGWKISMRNQSKKINVGDLAKKATKGIGSGGGHIQSAGALVQDWDLFRKRVVDYVSSKTKSA